MNQKDFQTFNDKLNKPHRSKYNVNGIYKTGYELTYNDVKYLYDEYYRTYGKYLSSKSQVVSNNVPHSKILARVLKEQGITLNDWQNSYGLISHVRSDPKHYDIYLKKFKDLYVEKGCIRYNELIKNNLGLPNPNFFIKYCPDKSVKDYVSFIRWCGFKHNKIKEKEDIVNALIEYENNINRPITKDDLCVDKIGFSEIVIKRLWGTFSKCKEELGLIKTQMNRELYTFEEYKKKIDDRLDEIIKVKGRTTITWNDLETKIGYETPPLEHHSVYKKFNNVGMDYAEYFIKKGFRFIPSSYGHSQMFPDGEKTKSNFEYDYSTFLREIGFNYNDGYTRDVMYKLFCNGLDDNSKMNCDYKVTYNDKDYYIEIAGILESEDDLYADLTDDTDIKYRDKMIIKRDLLKKSNINYLFLYSKDMNDDSYKIKTKNFLGMV